jgi:hypothetical protein
VHGRSLIIGRTGQANLNHYRTVVRVSRRHLGSASPPTSDGRCCRSDRAASRYLNLAALHILRLCPTALDFDQVANRTAPLFRPGSG